MSNVTVNSNPILLSVTNERIALSVVSSELALSVSGTNISFSVVSNPVAITVESSEIALSVASNPVVLEFNTGNVTITNNYGADTVAITAAENLGGHRIITVEGYYASKDTATDKNKVLGMTTGAASVGTEATVAVSGFIEESSWNWNVDLPVFLSTNGQLTQSTITSGFSLIVGKPRTATNLFISISEPIILI